jgi:hypothetical protein
VTPITGITSLATGSTTTDEAVEASCTSHGKRTLLHIRLVLEHKGNNTALQCFDYRYRTLMRRFRREGDASSGIALGDGGCRDVAVLFRWSCRGHRQGIAIPSVLISLPFLPSNKHVVDDDMIKRKLYSHRLSSGKKTSTVWSLLEGSLGWPFGFDMDGTEVVVLVVVERYS